jgi:general secretion pathway protein J
MKRVRRKSARRVATGFTLLELLVAITVLAFVSMIAWRGLDALLKTRERLEPPLDDTRALLGALGQLERDVSQLAPPAIMTLPIPALAIAGGDGGSTLTLTRLAARDAALPTGLQRIQYRVADGMLLREAAPVQQTLSVEATEAISTARLLGGVRSLQIRIWANEGWAPPGTRAAPSPGSAPPIPGAAAAVPPGIEVTIERSDGQSYRRVLLIG